MNRYKNTIVYNKAYGTTRYPEIPLSEDDIYVYTVQGDRFDALANLYYNDSSLWWIISVANTAIVGTSIPNETYTSTSIPTDLKQDSLVIPEGIQIRIPNNYNQVLESFKRINN